MWVTWRGHCSSKQDTEFLLFSLCEEEQQEALARLDTARAELKAAGEEVDRLYYLSTFGRSREEMAQKNTIRPVGLQPIAHQPSPPPPRKLR